MSGLTPAPTMRVHDPSGVATHGVALRSAGESKFRYVRSFVVIGATPQGVPITVAPE